MIAKFEKFTLYRLWAVGGFNGKDFLKTVEFLDPNSDEWTNILTIEEKSEFKDENQEVSQNLNFLKLTV